MTSIFGWTRAALVLAALVSGGLAAGSPALAQSYPTRPISIVVPIGAGRTGRTWRGCLGDLSQRLGKPVIVENRPGAGDPRRQAVAAMPPDGYSLMVAISGTFATYPVLYKKLRYDPQGFHADLDELDGTVRPGGQSGAAGPFRGTGRLCQGERASSTPVPDGTPPHISARCSMS